MAKPSILRVAVTMGSLAVFLPALVQALNYWGWSIKTGPGLELIFLVAAVWMTWVGSVALGIGLAAVCGILVSIAAYATSQLIGAQSRHQRSGATCTRSR